MATPWPAGLPSSPLVGSGAMTSVPNRIEFSPDVGPLMSRQRTTRVQRDIPFGLIFSEAQVSIFLTFYDVNLRSGSLPFATIDPFKFDLADFKFNGEYSIEYLATNVYRFNATCRRIS